jgi:hypothetical protein
VIEGLACRRAAETSAALAAKQGPALLEAGRKAVASGSVAKMIAADMRFHTFIHALSGNALIAPALATHLTYTQRVMGEVLIEDQEPRDIWDQHAKILDAIGKGKADLAEKLASNAGEAADDAVHDIGHLLEAVREHATKAGLTDAATKALDELEECFGKVDEAFHSAEENADPKKVLESVKERLDAAFKALTEVK